MKNGEAYIGVAIRSILFQTFADFELLVIDDGSSDGATDVAEHLANRTAGCTVLRNPGSGLVDALNFGIASARAPLIARMDGDDIALPERFQKQHDFLQAHPDIDVVGTQVIFIDEKGEAHRQENGLTPRPRGGGQDPAEILLSPASHRADAARSSGKRGRLPLAAHRCRRFGPVAAAGRARQACKLARSSSVLPAARRTGDERKNVDATAFPKPCDHLAQERRAGRSDPIAAYTCFGGEAGKHSCGDWGAQTRYVIAYEHSARRRRCWMAQGNPSAMRRRGFCCAMSRSTRSAMGNQTGASARSISAEGNRSARACAFV